MGIFSQGLATGKQMAGGGKKKKSKGKRKGRR